MSEVKITKFIPHKDLQQNWSFFSINFRDKELVYGVKWVIKKVYTLCNKDGTPKILPINNEPELSFDFAPIIQLFTPEEYNKLMIGDKNASTS